MEGKQPPKQEVLTFIDTERRDINGKEMWNCIDQKKRRFQIWEQGVLDALVRDKPLAVKWFETEREFKGKTYTNRSVIALGVLDEAGNVTAWHTKFGIKDGDGAAAKPQLPRQTATVSSTTVVRTPVAVAKNDGYENRDTIIARQVALKAGVELAAALVAKATKVGTPKEWGVIAVTLAEEIYAGYFEKKPAKVEAPKAEETVEEAAEEPIPF